MSQNRSRQSKKSSRTFIKSKTKRKMFTIFIILLFVVSAIASIALIIFSMPS